MQDTLSVSSLAIRNSPKQVQMFPEPSKDDCVCRPTIVVLQSPSSILACTSGVDFGRLHWQSSRATNSHLCSVFSRRLKQVALKRHQVGIRPFVDQWLGAAVGMLQKGLQPDGQVTGRTLELVLALLNVTLLLVNVARRATRAYCFAYYVLLFHNPFIKIWLLRILSGICKPTLCGSI